MASGFIKHALPIVEVPLGFGTSSDVESLVRAIIEQMPTPGIYVVHGSWTGHSYGYNAICECDTYSSSENAYSGLITGYDGNVWTFNSRASQSAITIKKLSTV